MSYRVVLDGYEFLDNADKTLALVEPKLEAEVNTVDSFEFKMPPIHKYYSVPLPLKSTVEIYEDLDMIWFGRVLSIGTDYYRQKEIVCEGPLGWFNDTIQRPHEYDKVSLHQFFRDVIDNHNAMAPENRQFTVGEITVEDTEVYRKLDYNTSEDALTTMCINAEGGYLFFRRIGGINYIDWLKDMPYDCNQPVEFGLNMLDISSTFNGGDIITAIIPLGDTVQENDDPDQGEIINPDDPRVGKPLTLEHDYGSDILGSVEAVAQFGFICEAVSFSGVKSASELYEKAQKYLEDKLFNKLTFECSAIELKHFGAGANDNYDHFKLGQMVKVRSKPHALDTEFPHLKMSIDLDTASKEINLGTKPHQSLTKIVNNNIESEDGSRTGATSRSNGATQNYNNELRIDRAVIKNSDAIPTSGAVWTAIQTLSGGDWKPIKGINFDFSHWSTGTLVEYVDEQVVHHFSILFDGLGRPVKFTDSEGNESDITW